MESINEGRLTAKITNKKVINKGDFKFIIGSLKNDKLYFDFIANDELVDTINNSSNETDYLITYKLVKVKHFKYKDIWEIKLKITSIKDFEQEQKEYQNVWK